MSEFTQKLTEIETALKGVKKLARALPCLGKLGIESCDKRRGQSIEARCGHCMLEKEIDTAFDTATICKDESTYRRAKP